MDAELKQQFTSINQRMDEQFSAIYEQFNGLREYLDENMATKDEIAQIRLEMATKEELAALRMETDEIRAEMATKSDIRNLTEQITEVKESVETNNQRCLQDSNAFAKSIIELRRDVNHLKLSQA